ncbi:APC family permease [Longivirga aurantiaca]|uniref:APC family permease n=1 Tax=Longivirga aurantiaca TaxID=1837743 RepID=A0ABW1SVV2_9ACTN
MTSDSVPRLERRLGLGGAVAIGLGAMLGTGVFAAWTPAYRLAGPLLLVSLGIAALVAGLNAWSTAALARVHSESGGAYAYGRARLGRAAGVLAGWAFVVGKIASAGAAALTIGAYVAPAYQRPLGVAAIALVLLLDLRGVTKTAAVSAVVSGVVIAVLLWLSLAAQVGRASLASSSIAPGVPGSGAGGVLGAAGLLFVAFAGYARIATLGEEVREPRRTLPRAMAISFAVVVSVYVLVAVALLTLLAALPVQEWTAAPLETLARLAGGGLLTPAVRLAAVLAAGGALLSLLAGVGRTLFAMGRGADAPAALAAVSRHGVPHRAQIVAAVGAAVVVLVGGIGAALALSAVSILTYYGVAHLAALRLGTEEGRPPRIVPLAGLAGCAAVALSLLLLVSNTG